MPQFIDRRLNPKGKSLANRQRFIRRAKASIRDAVQKELKDGKVTDFVTDKKISIPSKTTREPRFHLDPKTGEQSWVVPGNKEFSEGDQIKKPPQGGGQGSGKQAGDSDAEDSFEFTLTREELMDVLFDDLELPDLIKTTLKDTQIVSYRRAGYTTSGSPTNISIVRTMRHALGRRIALRRPKQDEIDVLYQRLETLDPADGNGRALLLDEIAQLEAKRRRVGFIDPVDVRYNAFDARPEPAARAVMFCLMDVSGSMGEREKDLAKRFYMLLHLFLQRRYQSLDVVFIRHTHEAQEVDEKEFFYSRMSGGTVVSSALELMLQIVAQRYATSEWNIYVAQASDGYTQAGDAQACVEMLHSKVMPAVQHYAYIEILDEREMSVFASDEAGAELWRSYRGVSSAWKSFAAKRIAKPADIYPVFRELFAKENAA
ncbi:MAG: YeaH/YhbH family protein [Alphaproteobacteria bacterium]|nr:YeaH/YhbH family protein [Alphaproteobacteria bacterium]